jgi:hypothetical protein
MLASENLRDIADIAASAIETVDVFLLFNRGSSDDSEMCFPPFKRKNRIILLHTERKKWASISSFFQTSGFRAERNNDTGMHEFSTGISAPI